MNHVGVDLHKETSLFYIIDKNGKKLLSPFTKREGERSFKPGVAVK